MNITIKFVTTVLLTITVICLAAETENLSNIFEAELVSSTPTAVRLNFVTHVNEAINFQDVNNLPLNYQTTGEGFTYEFGKPILPSVTRLVIVPPNAGLELSIQFDEPQSFHVDSPPIICSDVDAVKQQISPEPNNGYYPDVIAEMSSPFVVRGVRMVSVHTYPVRYNESDNTLLLYNNIQVEVVFTDAEPVNPARTPVRRNRSREFLKFIHSLAINPNDVGRDDPDRDHDPEYIGHYLIVANDRCLPYAVPFIEWRRKSGWKIDIISVTNNDEANNANAIKALIQELYNSYLDDGIDPFDQILLIGDLTSYVNLQPPPNWILASFGHHYDWYYALLEGNDTDADVGISRWCAGTRDLVELFTHRTLAYEAVPNMEDPDWLDRAAVYAQYWGRNWHVSLATNVRWGKEVLENIGFGDINTYENITNPDGAGQQVGPFIRDQYNSGVSVMIGRAENYYFRGNLPGVNDNDVFPIDIYLGGHQEYSVWTLLRTGTMEHPKGPVAVTCGWGNPNTFSMSNIWLEQVSGFLQHDLTFGWARLKGLIGPRAYIPNYEAVIGRYRTDIMYYGDPGIQYWKGVPLVVEGDHPDNIAPDTKSVIVQVTDEDGNSVENAQVTFYVPGEMPDPDDDDEYADYTGMLMLTVKSNSEGDAQFFFDNEFEGDVAFVTITGREILPYFGEIDIRDNISAIELSSYTLSETEGNEDDVINPGETFTLDFTAINRDNRNEMENVTAIISSASPWLDIEENEISFGDIDAEAEADGDQSITLTIHPSCPDGLSRPKTNPIIDVEFHSGDITWYSLIKLVPEAPNYELHRFGAGDQISTRPRNFEIYIKNVGELNAPETSARLVSLDMGIRVILDEARYPAIRSGRNARIAGDRFRITGTQDAVPGARYNMLIVLNNEQGFVDTVFFDLQVDEPRDDSPQGPDDFGYICYDDTDDDWDVAPVYDWIEISRDDQDRDVDGTLLGFEGRSQRNIGESLVIDLPFETQFYGETYDQITVSTNGFIAMGNQRLITNFQNWPMDRAIGGGVGMLAPLWDDLKISDDGGVYQFYDEETASFIIEWYKMRHRVGGNSDLTFQVVLYDNNIWVSGTGDQRIAFYYKQVADVRGRGEDWINSVPYASVGISSPDGTTGLNYSYNNIRPVTSAPLENQRALLFTNSPIHSAGILLGTLTDRETGEPIENAVISTLHGFRGESDDEGNWIIDDALAGIEFSLSFYKQGYSDSVVVELFLEEGDTLEINIALLHPEFIASIDEVDTELEARASVEISFDVNNTGNGTLNWQAETVIVTDEEINPWAYREGINVGQILDQNRVQGVVFVDDHYYISVTNNGEPIICKFNRDGELIEEYDQPMEDNRGMRDLAYDGELIWGAIDDQVYGFTPAGEVVYEWESERNPTTLITWDKEREVLWLGSTTSNIIAYNVEGELQEDMTINRRGLRIYGLAFLPEDPDDHQLYVFNKDADTGLQTLHKFNVDTGDTIHVTTLIPEAGGSPLGAFISYSYSNYSTVLMTISNTILNEGGDHIDVWQIDKRRDWIKIDPTEGSLSAGEEQEFELTLDALNLPDEEFEAEVVFYHNSTGGETSIPVTLKVQLVDRDIRLDLIEGWNQVSLNVEPNNMDVTHIMRRLTVNGALTLLKDGQGRFYNPQTGFNNIGEWNTESGYQMHLTEARSLDVTGRFIPIARPIELEEGWNLKSYYPWHPVNAEVALSGIIEELVIAKDGYGHFYLPEFNFNNLGNLTEGNGYQFKMNEAAELIYRRNGGDEVIPNQFNQPEYFTNIVTTEFNMSVLIISGPGDEGKELGAFDAGGTLIGAGRFDSAGKCGFAVFGEANSNSGLTFSQWQEGVESEVVVEPIEGELNWTANGILVGRINSDAGNPVEFGIHKMFPNPTNGPVQIEFGLEAAGTVSLIVYDLTGRQTATILNHHLVHGNHRISWDTSIVPSGVYIVKLRTRGQGTVRKFAILK